MFTLLPFERFRSGVKPVFLDLSRSVSLPGLIDESSHRLYLDQVNGDVMRMRRLRSAPLGVPDRFHIAIDRILGAPVFGFQLFAVDGINFPSTPVCLLSVCSENVELSRRGERIVAQRG